MLTLIGQVRAGLAPFDLNSLFPYYLTPAGFAYFWGFYPISQQPIALLFDIAVVSGALAFFLALLSSFWLAYRGQAVAIVAAVMLVVGLRLFWGRFDFGLFKIAMYIQPFLLGTIAVCWVKLYRRLRNFLFLRRVCLIMSVVLVSWGAHAQLFYTQRSLGYGGSGLVEVPYA